MVFRLYIFVYECCVSFSTHQMSVFICVHITKLFSSYIFHATEAPAEAFVAVGMGWLESHLGRRGHKTMQSRCRVEFISTLS